MNNSYNVPNKYIGQTALTNYSNNDERLASGFVFPFLLGGVTGAAIAPAFWNPSYYPPRPYPPRPYPPRPYPPRPYPPRPWR